MKRQASRQWMGRLTMATCLAAITGAVSLRADVPIRGGGAVIGKSDPVVVITDGIVIEDGIWITPAPGQAGTGLAERAPVDLPVVSSGFADDQEVSGSLAPIIDALHSSVFLERDEATHKLLRLPPGRLPEIVSALEHEGDSEAVARLKVVAGHLFLKARTALQRPSLLGLWFKDIMASMLGVRFKIDPIRVDPRDEDLTMTIMVTEVELGFPAYQSLRAGDRIVALNGQKFRIDAQDTDFTARVREFWPGAVLHLTVVRDGKSAEIPVQLAGVSYSSTIDVVSAVSLAIEQRSQAVAAFISGLKTGEKSKPLIMEDGAAEAARVISTDWDQPVPVQTRVIVRGQR